MAINTAGLCALERKARKWTRAIAMLGLAGLLMQAFGILIDVSMRWLFNSPLFGMEDINGLLITIIIASFFPALLIDRGNVTLTFLGRWLGPEKEEWLNAFGQLVTLMFFILATWQLARYSVFVAPQTTPILQLPLAPAWWLATSLIALCVPVQLLVFCLHLAGAINKCPVETEATGA